VAEGLVGRNRRRNIARNNNTICTQSRFLTDDYKKGTTNLAHDICRGHCPCRRSLSWPQSAVAHAATPDPSWPGTVAKLYRRYLIRRSKDPDLVNIRTAQLSRRIRSHGGILQILGL
jgi:hypothetical protein